MPALKKLRAHMNPHTPYMGQGLKLEISNTSNLGNFLFILAGNQSRGRVTVPMILRAHSIELLKFLLLPLIWVSL
jgi:hypothetical protein